MLFPGEEFGTESAIADFVRQMPLCASIADPDGKILACSESWAARVLAERAGATLAEVPCRIRLPRGGGMVESSLADCAGEVLRSESPLRLRSQRLDSQSDGERTVHIRIVPWYRGPGEVGGTSIFLRDVTDRVRLGYRIAHDLVAPMSFFAGYIELLREDLRAGKTEHMGRMLEVLQGSVDNLSTLVDHLLNLARAEHNEPDCSRIEIRGLVDQAIAELEIEFGPNRVRLQNDCNDTTWLAEGFPLRLIVLQLLRHVSESCKPTETGSTIRIAVGRVDSGVVKLIVRHDTGTVDGSVAADPGGAPLSCPVRLGLAGDGWDVFLIRQLAARLDGEVVATRGEFGSLVELRIPDLGSAESARPTPTKVRRSVLPRRPRPDRPPNP